MSGSDLEDLEEGTGTETETSSLVPSLRPERRGRSAGGSSLGSSRMVSPKPLGHSDNSLLGRVTDEWGSLTGGSQRERRSPSRGRYNAIRTDYDGGEE
jgi:hypothetical protein